MEALSNLNSKTDKSQQINTVLVIDDDDNWCFITKKMLEKAGIGKQIIMANNGRKALEIIQSVKANNEKLPELIFLDLKMPVMDGFEFLKEITSLVELNLSQSQIYICTSSILPKDKERASQYPISGFITKPITQEILKNIIS